MILGAVIGRCRSSITHTAPQMSRKLKKGYFVQGRFVAEGSELDLELKRELKGSDEASRTDMKRESDALQKLGEDLLSLNAERIEKLGLPEKLVDAVAEARRITNFEGKRRQMQFIGKLMRKLEDAQLDTVRDALQSQHSGSVNETLALHQTEQWRDALLATDGALALWLEAFPHTDTQQLRALIRQARKDIATLPKSPAGEAPRHGKAYREIFQFVKAHLSDVPEQP